MSNKKRYIIPVFVPHKGCPHDCIFCNQKTISGYTGEISKESTLQTIEQHLGYLKRDIPIEIAFYGGSFTGIDLNVQQELLECAGEYIKKGIVQSIRVSTRPDYINTDILSFLKKYNVKTIELGVQSLDDKVLSASCRGHSVQDVYNAVNLIKKAGIILGIQTMIGLPEDSMEKALETARKVAGLKPDIVRIYPTLVVKDTYLEKLYYSGKYKPLSLEDAVSLAASLLEIYYSQGIEVIRVGLQPTEEISESSSVIAGPFHPAFRQLAESHLNLSRIKNIIEKMGLKDVNKMIVLTGISNVSNVSGQNSSNLKKIKELFNIREIKLYGIKELGREIAVAEKNN